MTGLSAALFAKYLCLLRRGKPLAFRMGSWNGAKPNLDGRTGHFRYNRHFWNTRNRLRLLPAAGRSLDEVEQNSKLLLRHEPRISELIIFSNSEGSET